MQAAIAAALAQFAAGDAESADVSARSIRPKSRCSIWGCSSPTLPLSKVDEYAETYLAQRISMISGVAQVQVYGSQKYAVRIQLDPQALASRGIGIDEVAQAIQSATSTCRPARCMARTRPLPYRPTAN